jgi:lipid II:glycine glycyltransferase (peptidoglycan interpeptide bridge formation enzyme)
MNLTKTSFNKLATHPLQTWEWGEFRTNMGNKVVRFVFGQITVHKIPHTPFSVAVLVKCGRLDRDNIKELLKYCKEYKVIFVKIEPNILLSDDRGLIGLLKKHGAVKGKRLFTPKTFILDLKESEEDLLKSFHPKTRYNIKLAIKKGVTVEEKEDEKSFEKYLDLTFDTAKRQNFFAHTKKYHRTMWEVLHKKMVANGDEPIAHLLIGSYKKEVLASWVVFVWKDTLYYPYGASSDKHREVMASHLMMWESIKFGKKLGLKKFDMWGLEEGKGFTRFKEGFRPKVVEFVGTWDIPVGLTKHTYLWMQLDGNY